MVQVLDHSNVFKYPHKKLFEQIMKQFPISLYVIQNFWQTWGGADLTLRFRLPAWQDIFAEIFCRKSLLSGILSAFVEIKYVCRKILGKLQNLKLKILKCPPSTYANLVF